MTNKTIHLHFKSKKTQAELQAFANTQRFHEKNGTRIEFSGSMRVIDAAYRANIITEEDLNIAIEAWESGDFVEAMFIEFSI